MDENTIINPKMNENYTSGQNLGIGDDYKIHIFGDVIDIYDVK